MPGETSKEITGENPMKLMKIFENFYEKIQVKLPRDFLHKFSVEFLL